MDKQLTVNQNIKEGIEGHPATWYSDVFGLVFPEVDTAAINSLWKKQLAKKDDKKKSEEKDESD